jgi:hypothetical protein
VSWRPCKETVKTDFFAALWMHLYSFVTPRQQNSTLSLLLRKYPIDSCSTGTEWIVAFLSDGSTLFWWLLAAAFAVTELGATAILVQLSAKPPPDGTQE